MSTISDTTKSIRVETTRTETRSAPAPRPGKSRGPLGLLLDLFSSVPLGITLLSILFVYSSIGSAGIVYPTSPAIFSRDVWVHAQIRQWPMFEMTEYEWFHWWPFNLLILLLCVNLTVTTLRRIRLTVINLGVWMIHSGIIVLAIGSLIYFGTKVEGDVPIARRHVTISVDGAVDGSDGPVTATILAMPGARAELDTADGLWTFEVAAIDPAWELLTGAAAGERAYSVNVMVETPQRRFMRQLLAGHPELTEDIIVAADTGLPMQRAMRATGNPIVEPRLTLGLEYEPAEYFYLRNDLVKSWALYLRRPGETDWVQRNIKGLPFYNDYVSERGHVLQAPGDRMLPLRPIDVRVPATSADDPIADVDLRIDGYLRFAQTRALLRPGGVDDPINPAIWVRVAAPEVTGPAARGTEYRMLALDPQSRRADGGLLAFRWAATEEEFKAIAQPPALTFEIPHLGIAIDGPIVDTAVGNESLAFTPLVSPDGPDGEDSGYAYRVMAIQDDLSLSVGVHSMAVVELRTPSGTFRRWVFEDDALTRDVRDDGSMDAHGAPAFIDDRIRVGYRAGTGLGLLTIVAGPEERDLRLVVSFDENEPIVIRLESDRTHPLPGGLTVRVTDYYPRAVVRPMPMVVPPNQRVRDAGEFFSQARLVIDGQEATFANNSPWVLFHRYPFPSADRMLRRHIFEPTLVRLEDGREFEVVLSRQRLPLPAPMALDDFRLATHIGGFTGESLTIRNYTSHVRFRDADGQWGEPTLVSVNAPITKGGLSFFQAQWDPPDDARRAGPAASAGLNYTVLGVGSRHGVMTQLIGCCIAVIGMLYAFYVKPVLKRRRQLEVEAMVASGELRPRRGASELSAGHGDGSNRSSGSDGTNGADGANTKESS